ncbi:hypothetical protein GCM10022420_073110 [Streptomyces iranensis]
MITCTGGLAASPRRRADAADDWADARAHPGCPAGVWGSPGFASPLGSGGDEAAVVVSACGGGLIAVGGQTGRMAGRAFARVRGLGWNPGCGKGRGGAERGRARRRCHGPPDTT